MTPPRVLLSAYQCAPGEGSVSQIGFEWYSRLARVVPLTLVTHVRNKRSLEKAGAAGGEILYVDTEAFAGPLYRLASRLFPRSQHAVFLLSSLDYFVFDRKSRRMLAKLQKQTSKWDLVHCATPVSPLASPTLHRLGLPIVLGPWNGGLESPTTFPEFMKQDSSWLYPLKNIGRVFAKFNRGWSKASLILTANATTDKSIPEQYRSRCVRMLENGVDFEAFSPQPFPPAPSAVNPLKVIFVGRLLPFKGVPMLLDAMHRVTTATPVQLSIVGDGPEATYLKEYVERLCLGQCVTFHGNKSLAEVSVLIGAAHVLCLPSVRESGGSVLLEAMTSGRPVVAVAYGGPAELVDEEVGRAIQPVSRDHVVSELEQCLHEIVRHYEVWQQKGERARVRALQQFGWELKVRHAVSLYESVFRDPGSEPNLRSN